MNRRIHQVLCTVCLLLITGQVIAGDNLSQQIDEYIQNMHEAYRFDGAILVAAGDEVILKKGYGLADRTFGIANEADTRFLIGSVSKQFISMLILQLVQDGKIDLDAPAQSYLPDLPDDKAGITIHQLLNHTSGLPHYNGIGQLDIDIADHFRLYRPVSDYVEMISQMALQSDPGERFSYSSMGYIMLGYIAEQVSGKSFGELIQERIAGPLGLKGTGFSYSGPIVERLARGYRCVWMHLPGDRAGLGYLDEPYRDQSNKYCTGGVNSTVEDMYVWAQALMTDKLLSDDLRGRMFTPGMGSYGYGWRIVSGAAWGRLDADIEVISHSGKLAGYNSHIAIFDRGAYTIVVLTNTSRGWSQRAAHGVASILYSGETMPHGVASTVTANVLGREGIEAGRRLHQQLLDSDFAGYYAPPPGYIVHAEELSKLDHHAEALALIEFGRDMQPNDGSFHIALGDTYRKMQRPEDAERSYRKAIALCDSHPKINGRKIRKQATDAIEALTSAAEPAG